MSCASNHSSLQQGCVSFIPAEAQLSGEETLEDFVRMIRVRENSRTKRDRLPDLAPCDVAENYTRTLIKRVKQKILCLN